MISVVLALYNGASYIVSQLDSIAVQSRPVDEILVRDDGSTDESIQTVLGWKQAHPEVKVTILQAAGNAGYRENFHVLLQNADGDVIFLCDQDDVWEPDKVEKMMEVLEQDPEILALGSSFRFLDDENRLYDAKVRSGWSNQNMIPVKAEPGSVLRLPFPLLFYHNPFQGCAMAIRKELRDTYLNRYTDAIPHDWLLSLLAANAGGLAFLNVPLFQYRVQGQNTIGLPQASKNPLLAKLDNINKKKERMAVFQDGLDVVQAVHDVLPERYGKEQESLERFLKEMLEALEIKDTALYRQLMKDPRIFKYKSKKGILLDLVYLEMPEKKEEFL